VHAMWTPCGLLIDHWMHNVNSYTHIDFTNTSLTICDHTIRSNPTQPLPAPHQIANCPLKTSSINTERAFLLNVPNSFVGRKSLVQCSLYSSLEGGKKKWNPLINFEIFILTNRMNILEDFIFFLFKNFCSLQ
jgi:hypothetical protein